MNHREPIACGPKTHVWCHTDGDCVFEPEYADLTDPNKRCVCGSYWYSQRFVLLVTGFTVGSIPAAVYEQSRDLDIAVKGLCRLALDYLTGRHGAHV